MWSLGTHVEAQAPFQHQFAHQFVGMASYGLQKPVMMATRERAMAAMSSASLSRATNAGRLGCLADSCVVTICGWRGRLVMTAIFNWKTAVIHLAKWRMDGRVAPLCWAQQMQRQCVRLFVVMARSKDLRHAMMAIWQEATDAMRIAA